MRISIGRKLTISYLLVALLVGVLGVIGYSNMRETGKQVDVIREESARLVILTDMKSQILEGIEEAFAYPLLDDPQEKAEFYEKLDQFDSMAAQFEHIARVGLPGQEVETELYKQIITAKGVLEIAAGNMFESYERDGAVNQSHVASFEEAIDDVIPLIDRFLEIGVEEVAQANQDIQATIANADRLTFIVVSAAVVLAIGLGLFLSRTILIPINILRDVAEELGEGNLSIRANVESKDEIGSLANSFNQMASGIQQAEEERAVLFEELTVLYDISQIFSQLGDFKSKTTRVMERMAQSSGADWATLRMPKEDQPGLHLLAAAGPAVAESPPIPVFTEAQTLSTAAFTEGRTIVIDDYVATPSHSQTLVDLGMQSMVILPIRVEGRTVALVTVISKDKRYFTPRLVGLLTAVGGGLGTLLENSMLHDENQQSDRAQRRLAQESQVMAEIGQEISSSLEIEEVYERFAELVRKILPFDWITINTVDMQSGTTTLAYVTGVEIPGRATGTLVPLAGTFTERVMQSSEGLTFQPDDLKREASVIPGLMPYFEAECRSFLGVPLLSRGEVIAVLNMVSTLPQAYSAQDLDLAMAIGQQIAGAIANAQQYAERRRSEQETRILADLGRIISSSLDINEVYQTLGEQIKKAIPFDRLSLNLINKENQTTSPTWLMGTAIPGREATDQVPFAGALSGEVVQTRSPIMLEVETPEDIEDRFPLLMPAFEAGLRSFLTVPLIDRGEIIGIMQMRSKERGVYSQRHLEFAERIARQIARAISNAQLYADWKRLAEENSVVAEIGRVVSSSLDVNEVYDLLGEAIKGLIPFDRMSLSLVD